MTTTEIIDQQTLDLDPNDLYHIDHQLWIAQEAAKLGFPIAGFVGEIYQDAVVLIPPTFRFDWKPGRVLTGRVLAMHHEERNATTNFILITENGTQVPKVYGRGHACFFALPEDTENKFRS